MTDFAQGDRSLAAVPAIDNADMRRRIKAIFIGSIGNLVEWYDFYAYAAFSLYFAGAFFPGTDPVLQQLSAATVFAAGFLVRPIGGWLFGHLADNNGRRFSLTLSVALMCLGSLMIAVTPTFASVGVMAPVILSLARIIQGISLGGEYGASATYLSEVADPKRRGFYSSFQYVTLIGGQLAAILVLLVPQKLFLTNDEIRAWGWRIPFFIGALLAIVAAIMRSQLHETEAFEAVKKSAARRSSLEELLKHPREVLLVIGLTLGGTAAFYTYTTYMQTFLKLSVGLDDDTTTLVTAGSLIFALVLQPLYGHISDHIGRRPHLVRRLRRRLHLCVARGHPRHEERLWRLLPHLLRLDDRRRLYINQRDREGRTLSGPHPRDGRWPALRADRLDLRRLGPGNRIVV